MKVLPLSTLDGGPHARFVGSDITFTNLQADQDLSCAQIDFAATVADPGVARHFSENAAVLDELTASGCTNDIGGTTFVVLAGTPSVSITGDTTVTAWPARLSDVSAVIAAVGCSFTVEGSVDGVFDTVTQVVMPTDNTLVSAPLVGRRVRQAQRSSRRIDP